MGSPPDDLVSQTRDKLCFWLITNGKRAVALEKPESEDPVRVRSLDLVLNQAVSFSGYVRRHTLKSGFSTKHQTVYYAVVYAENPDQSRSLVYVGEGHGGNGARKKALEEAEAGAIAYPDAVKWMNQVLKGS